MSELAKWQEMQFYVLKFLSLKTAWFVVIILYFNKKELTIFTISSFELLTKVGIHSTPRLVLMTLIWTFLCY